MATVTINFESNLDQSLSIGDTLYSSGSVSSSGGFTTASSPIELGEITALNRTTQTNGNVGAQITIDTNRTEANINSNVAPTMLLFYAKNNTVNLSSILGYYAEIKLTNTSTSKSELFQIGVDVFESSGHE